MDFVTYTHMVVMRDSVALHIPGRSTLILSLKVDHESIARSCCSGVHVSSLGTSYRTPSHGINRSLSGWQVFGEVRVFASPTSRLSPVFETASTD